MVASLESSLISCSRYLIPRFDGAILWLEWKEAVWDKFVMGTPRPRSPSEQQYSDRDAEPGARDQSQDGGKVAKADTVEDLKAGQKAPHSTTMTEAEEAMVVVFRRHTLLPPDDCLYTLQPSISTPARSALYAAYSVTASPVYRTSRATSSNANNSSATRSASFTSISPRFRLPKASSTCSMASTARASSPSYSCSTRLIDERRGSS